MNRYRFNHIVVGEIVESDLIETGSIEEWKGLPQSSTGDWSTYTDRDTGRVLANRIVGVPVVREPRLGAYEPTTEDVC